MLLLVVGINERLRFGAWRAHCRVRRGHERGWPTPRERWSSAAGCDLPSHHVRKRRGVFMCVARAPWATVRVRLLCRFVRPLSPSSCTFRPSLGRTVCALAGRRGSVLHGPAVAQRVYGTDARARMWRMSRAVLTGYRLLRRNVVTVRLLLRTTVAGL